MAHSFEESFVRNCAATLAGHKCGSLFSYHKGEGENVSEALGAVEKMIESKGVRVRLLRECENGALIYVYRPAMLEKRLARGEVRIFLEKRGYAGLTMDECINALARRVHCGEEFPHEIGVFLDYPLEDVVGYIENRGDRALCAGCWKAYSNADEAQRRFALYRKCREVYLRCYRKGFGVARLTVAA